MPIIKSAKKRVKVANKAAIRNSKTKRSLKAALKSFGSAVSAKKVSSEVHANAQSALDKAAKKGVMHKNKVARKKAQLARAAKAAGGTAAPKKTTASAKKATTRKTTATKKAASKPVAAKKPAAKKAAPKK